MIAVVWYDRFSEDEERRTFIETSPVVSFFNSTELRLSGEGAHRFIIDVAHFNDTHCRLVRRDFKVSKSPQRSSLGFEPEVIAGEPRARLSRHRLPALANAARKVSLARCICVYMRVYARISVYMHVYACLCVYVRLCVCICAYIHSKPRIYLMVLKNVFKTTHRRAKPAKNASGSGACPPRTRPSLSHRAGNRTTPSTSEPNRISNAKLSIAEL